MMTRLILATTPWSQVAIVAVLMRATPEEEKKMEGMNFFGDLSVMLESYVSYGNYTMNWAEFTVRTNFLFAAAAINFATLFTTSKKVE